MPPSWAHLETDAKLYHKKPKLLPLPPLLIELGEHMWYICASELENSGPMVIKSCTVYRLSSTHVTEIQLQKCNNCLCSDQFISPNCQDIEIQNLNNHYLFTHELLECYTVAYTISPTPFMAFILEVSHGYADNGTGIPIVNDFIFCAAWFTYADLLCLENDMQCHICGLAPDNVIFDGVSISFSCKQLHSSIKPPTAISPHLEQKDKVSYVSKQQLILDYKL
ncbi:hypothetical protein BDQ17DRAFT_1257634 [Cyathus striatus]|nr:hypothetical protein BDQ17DRAFT_1257634 [Cyathus striatus]